MAEVFTIFLFFVVISITAVIFFGWIALTVLRLMIGGMTALFAPPRQYAAPARHVPVSHPRQAVRCATEGCYAINPPDARFCRRCGRGLPAGAAERTHVRRAAVW
jgi:hypothetical protein